MTKKDEQIKIILDNIDLDKIHTVMKSLNWTYNDFKNQEKRVPNANELKVVVKDCLNKAWKSENKLFKMGGFEAEVINGVIGIKFIVEECNPLANIFS